jgi:molybdate transport system substrate-binding protein
LKKRFPLCILLLLFLAACTGREVTPGAAGTSAASPLARGGDPSPTFPHKVEITVAAASDLQFAFADIAELFEQETGQQVTLVFGSTGQLAQQIENGAPYDLFAAANVDFIHQLQEKGLVLGDSVTLYARGRLVLVVNREAGVTAASLEDLLDPAIRQVAIANPEHAPYGIAARQALEAAGLWETLRPRIVYSENVRQALQFVQTGDAQAGIVALSVAGVPEITWTLIDETLHQPLDQALAVVASSPQPEAAGEFARFVNGEQGRPVMRRYGFVLPGEAPVMSPNQAP